MCQHSAKQGARSSAFIYPCRATISRRATCGICRITTTTTTTTIQRRSTCVDASSSLVLHLLRYLVHIVPHTRGIASYPMLMPEPKLTREQGCCEHVRRLPSLLLLQPSVFFAICHIRDRVNTSISSLPRGHPGWTNLRLWIRAIVADSGCILYTFNDPAAERQTSSYCCSDLINKAPLVCFSQSKQGSECATRKASCTHP